MFAYKKILRDYPVPAFERRLFIWDMVTDELVLSDAITRPSLLFVNGINDSGIVVGQIGGKGFCWDGKSFQILDFDTALAINNNGAIVGIERCNGMHRPVLYDKGEKIEVLTTGGLILNEFRDINDLDEIAGRVVTETGERRAVILLPLSN